MLAPIDTGIIAIYLITLLIIGYRSSRKQNNEDYLIAQRKLGTWQTMATVNASKTGSILMTFVAMVYLWGFSATWYFVGVIVGVFLFIPFATRLREKSDDHYYTLADYFRHNYGKTSATFASSLTILLMFGLATINIIAISKLFSFFTGLSFWIGAVAMAIIITAYLFLAGFKAVAKTDIIQYGAMLAIIVILATTIFKGSLIPVNEWNIFATTIPTLIGFFIAGILFPFASPDLWQRVYAAKGKKEIKNGLLLSIGIYAVFCFLLTLIAISVKVLFPGVDPDLALIHGLQNLLPTGLVGLAIVLLFSAIMSTLDTYLYTGASSIVQDFFIFKGKKAVKAIKMTLCALALICTLLAVIMKSLIISSYIFVAFYAVLAIPAIATSLKKSVKPRTIQIAFIVGIGGTICLLTYGIITKNISPSIVIGSIVASLIGLVIGWFLPKKLLRNVSST